MVQANASTVQRYNDLTTIQPMLAVHLENLLFLLLLVVAGLFQLLSRAARKRGTGNETKPTPKPRPAAPRPIPRAPVESDQERIRKFLEALGQPPASPPPSPLSPRPTYHKPLVLPRVPPFASPLPPLVTRPPDIPPQIPPEPVAPAVEWRPPRSASPELKFEVHEAQAPSQPAAVVGSATLSEAKTQPQAATPQSIDVKMLLRSPLGLRGAMIVREILGRPRSLREFELP
jgi:hypothetical protein